MWEYMNTNELCHYGILGMKWGVRRYQNEDGSLTAAGRERYNVEAMKRLRKANRYDSMINAKVSRGGYPSERQWRKANKLNKKYLEIKNKLKEYDSANSVWNDQKIVDVEKASAISKQLLPHDEKYALTDRAKEAAVTGMESMKKTHMGDYDYLSTIDVNDPYEQDWFLNEDQTIGYAEIADLANRGYSSSKIKNLIKSSYEIEKQMFDLYDVAESNNRYEDIYDTAPFNYSIFELSECANYLGGKYEKTLNNYINACIDYNKMKHSEIKPWSYISTDELYHYGILGMKWGIRRYQNKDGSLTRLGRMRYGTAENFNRVLSAHQKAERYKKNKKAYERQQKKNKKADEEIKRIKEAAGMKTKSTESKSISSNSQPKEKKISEMTNKEIQEKINRIQLEKQLKREMASIQAEKISTGKKIVNKIVNTAKSPAVQTMLVRPITQHVGNVLAAELKKSIEPSKSEKLKREAEDMKNKLIISNNKNLLIENAKKLNDYRNDPNYAAVLSALDKEVRKDSKKKTKSSKSTSTSVESKPEETNSQNGNNYKQETERAVNTTPRNDDNATVYTPDPYTIRIDDDDTVSVYSGKKVLKRKKK